MGTQHKLDLARTGTLVSIERRGVSVSMEYVPDKRHDKLSSLSSFSSSASEMCFGRFLKLFSLERATAASQSS
jgi:hypothetical protein